MAFPFFFLSLALTVGIVFSHFLFSSLFVGVSALASTLALSWLFYFLNRMKHAFCLLLISTFFLGVSLYSLHDRRFEENSLHLFKSREYADFCGTLYKSPSLGKDRDYLYLRVEKIFSRNREEKINGNLRVTVYRTDSSSRLSHLFVGDKLMVSARIISSKGFLNFNHFSRDFYFKTLNIHARASTKSPLLVKKQKSGRAYSLLHGISIIRRKLQKKIEQHFSYSDGSLSSQGAVLEALLLGERGRMDQNITRSLQEAGIYHLFAISGAHIAIISFLLFTLFRGFRVPLRLSYALLIGFLSFFALLVEGRPSVMRATIMAIAFLLGKLLWSNVHLINTISISAFILLLINPFSLFHVGFQLTFAATFSIILFFPRIIKYFPRLPLRISEILALTLTAQMGILPIMATAFHRVTFSSLILNYAAIPLVGIIMGFGYIFLSLSLLSGFIGKILSFGLKFLIDLLLASSHLLDWLPHISFRIPAPHMITTIGYFLSLALLLIKPRVKGQRLILLLCFFLFFGILISYPFPSLSENFKLTMIDVGQGESILIEFPGRKKMLVDGGGIQQGTFDIGENVVSPFLWKKGIKKIDYLVLTHAHPDHLNGLVSVARNFGIGEFWEAFSPSDSDNYARFKGLLPPSVLQKRKFRASSHREGSVTIEVLHPDKKDSPYVRTVHNDQSMVLRISFGQTAFLLTGDIGADAEAEILKSGLDITSQVLKSPHHGSLSSSSEAFLQRVHPRIIIISVGEGNRYGFPHPVVLQRYEQVGAKIYRTDLNGAIEVVSNGEQVFIRSASQPSSFQAEWP